MKTKDFDKIIEHRYVDFKGLMCFLTSRFVHTAVHLSSHDFCTLEAFIGDACYTVTFSMKKNKKNGK